LNDLLRENGCDEGYEGNAQSFRIVTKLALHRDKYPGLDLTRCALNAVLKYPWMNGSGQERKWGAYSHEREDFSWARELYSDPGDRRKSVEAEIMDWADDITYAVHDLEDFYRAGLIPLELFASGENSEKEQFLNGVKLRAEKGGPGSVNKNKVSDYIDAFKALGLVFPVVTEPYRGSRLQRATLRTQNSGLISRYISALKLQIPADNEESYVSINEDFRLEIAMLKQLTWHYVILTPSLATQQYGLQKIISDLFNIYKDDKEFRLVPSWILCNLEDDVSHERKVADIISSMTDAQAIQMHQRLTGAHPGSIRDWI